MQIIQDNNTEKKTPTQGIVSKIQKYFQNLYNKII